VFGAEPNSTAGQRSLSQKRCVNGPCCSWRPGADKC